MDITQKTFENFATKRFCNNHSATAERDPLKSPLLKLSSQLDVEAARAISFAVYNYIEEDHRPSGATPNKSIFRDLIEGLQHGSRGDKFSPYTLAIGRKTNDLDKIHLICGLGILGPQLRDEIFCQICKQMNGNRWASVQQKGWTLLASCLSIFLPSEEFAPYFENFIKSGPEKESHFCQEIFRRTKQNGNRYEPISSTEHAAIIKRETFTRDVQLMNGRVCNCHFDPATKALELRKQIKAANGMVDLFGFSFRIHYGNRVSKVVAGSDHIMDVVSSCEQIAREVNLETEWSIVFFKEIFSPWQSPSVDPKATELIYNQIISWIRSRKHKIDEEETLVKIAAKHCFVLHGHTANRNNMENSITYVVPDSLLGSKRNKHRLVEEALLYFRKNFHNVKKPDRTKYVDELVNYAKYNLTSDFTRHFELTQQSKEDPSILSVNWNNVRVFQKQSLGSWTLAFSEIMKVSYEKLKGRRVGTVTICTIHDDKRKLFSLRAEEIYQLLSFFLSGLRTRSKYLLALRGNNVEDNKRGQLGFRQGDLIMLKGSCEGETVQVTSRGYGVCQRSGKSGEFSGGLFYIIPALKTPSEALLVALRNGVVSDASRLKSSNSIKAPSEVGNGSRSISQEKKPQEIRKNNEMFLELREYENIRYPMNNPAAPNIHDILKPTILQHNNTILQPQYNSAPHSAKPKTLIALNDEDDDDYLKLSAPQAPHLPNNNSYTETTAQELGHEIEESQHEIAEYADDKSSPSESSVQVSYEEMHSLENSKTVISTTVVNDEATTSLIQPPEENTIQLILSSESTPEITTEIKLDESNVSPELPGESIAEQTTTFAEKNYSSLQTSGSFNGSPSHVAIATYITQPAGEILAEMKLTDVIFGTRISKTNAEDNVYLVIMRNIQAEENELIVERSWELMWLATGLYPSSENIRDEVINFLRSRTDGNPLARQCYARLVKMITHQGRRTYPPHIAEVQAIQTRMDLINHKVFFPDGSCQSFEVESNTTVRHLISVITESIGLKFISGCGLFFKIGEKVFGAADEIFFFDFIQRFIEIWRKSEKEYSISVNYQLFFLRKVWINVVPGADRVADCRLHYYQELSKYLRGYHQRTKEDSIKLAALVFRAEFGEDTDNLSEIPDTLNKLVPQDVISEMSVDEWVKTLGEALANNSHCVGDDAKIEFLKELSKLETFGAAFFHAKPNEPDDLPDQLLIAVRRDGFVVMKDVEKTIIEKYGFNEIIWWSSGGHIFRVDVEKSNEKKRLEFHTTLDYQIDDFLTSYISIYGSDNPAEGSITSEDEQ